VATNLRDNPALKRRSEPVFAKLDGWLEELSGVISLQRDDHERAHQRARELLATLGARASCQPIAVLAFATDILCTYAVELAAHQAELRRLLERLEADRLVPRVALGRAVLSAPQLLQLPTAVAIEIHLELLLAFSDARAVSLWTLWGDAELRHIGHSGRFDEEVRQTRQVARRLLSEGTRSQSYRDASGVLVECWNQPSAALIARGRATSSVDQQLLLEAAAAMLGAMLERDQLLSRRSRSEDAVLASTERRLARLRFDLHDGPQQDVVLLAEDLQLFGSQLRPMIEGDPNKDRLIGRLDDLQARLVAIDGDLRRISAFVQSPFLQGEALPDALRQLVDAFSARSGIEPDLQITGDFARLSDSQQITLLGLIREALSNIREHSEAKNVAIAVRAGAKGVEATVTDDGRGFDPEPTLVEAARGGHLGLVGMHERVRLLGGLTQIDSRPGGPTVISVRLPAGPAFGRQSS
jgi:signal transduction histidine kinase